MWPLQKKSLGTPAPERLLMDQLQLTAWSQLAPLQFTNQARLGVEHTVTFLLKCIYAHLDRPDSTVRVMCLTFGARGLALRGWQHCRLMLLTSHELLTTYTRDFSINSDSCHFQKFTGDSAVVGYICRGEEAENWAVGVDFITGCKWNHLLLNATKTKQLVVDFSREQPFTLPFRGSV